MPFRDFSTIVGTCGGTFLSVMPLLESEDLIRTAILAFVGALVSFSVSFSLKIVVKDIFSARFKSGLNFRKKTDKTDKGT